MDKYRLHIVLILGVVIFIKVVNDFLFLLKY